MRLKPKARVHLRLPSGPLGIRAYLAEQAARRSRPSPQAKTALAAGLIASGWRKEPWSDPQ